jgi:hypothetical protein
VLLQPPPDLLEFGAGQLGQQLQHPFDGRRHGDDARRNRRGAGALVLARSQVVGDLWVVASQPADDVFRVVAAAV